MRTSDPDQQLVGATSRVPRAGREPLAAARRHLEDGPDIGWEAPSRYGRGAARVRRALRRMLQPYTMRQAPFERSIVDSVASLSRTTAIVGQAALAVRLSGADVVDVKTTVGPLWLHRNDQLVTPHLKAGHAWEPELAAFLRRSLEPGMTFVDVGAHVGYFSVLAHQAMGAAGEIIAVEPQPETLDILRANLWRNGCLDALVIPVAAYSHFGHLELVVNEENRAGGGVGRENAGGTLIPCAPLDELLGSGKFDIVKIDAEGCDHLIVAGASRIIADNPELRIVVEFWPRAEKIRDHSPAEILDLYANAGLALHRIGSDGSLLPLDKGAVLSQSDEFFELVLARG